MQVCSLASVCVAVPLAGGHLTIEGVLWGALGGVGAGTGALALYRGLAREEMSVVGPISGVGAAAIPVLVGLALGERPSIVTRAGVVLILPAVWLIARVDDPVSPEGTRVTAGRAGIVEGSLAGVGFGVFFLALAQAGAGDGLWPSAASTAAAALLVTGVAVAQGARLPRRSGSRRTALTAASAGLCAGATNTLYLLATRQGLLVVVAVLAALYPAVTVLLARAVLHERSSRGQVFGLVMAAGAVVAITAG